MRALWLVFSLSPSVPATDHWFASDKVQHFFSSAFVQSMSYGALRATGVTHAQALTGASITTAVVGVGKEIHDRDIQGDFSLRDLTWDAAGAGAATVLLAHSRR
jgi:uncharacterized protein YfiM (DUF2279 family)